MEEQTMRLKWELKEKRNMAPSKLSAGQPSPIAFRGWGQMDQWGHDL